MKKENISDAVIRRLPRYYRQLTDLYHRGIVRTSSHSLGQEMNITASQIRQDFSCFGEFGQQGYGYNEKYLSRYFKEVSNISLKQYILERKIERANFLLNDTNLTISNISDSLGFSNYHNFVRTYKKVTSMTPSDYRNTYAKRIINHD